jgi:hypothetical protein
MQKRIRRLDTGAGPAFQDKFAEELPRSEPSRETFRPIRGFFSCRPKADLTKMRAQPSTERNPMKIKPHAVSAFFHPRALIGLGLGATSILLAVLGCLTFPSTARATGQCTAPVFTENGGTTYGSLYVQMSSDPGCTIYYTVRYWALPLTNPTHSSAVYNPSGNPNYEGLGIPRGYVVCYKALAADATGDSAISSYCADNTGN